MFLSHNYRCKSDILTPVIASINTNINRVPKQIIPYHTGGSVAFSKNSSYGEIATQMEKDYQENEDVAIIVRTNNLRMFISDILCERNIPVAIGNMNYSLRNNKAYKTAMGIIRAIKYKDNAMFSEFGYPLARYMSKFERENYRKNFNTNWLDDILIREVVRIPSATKKLITSIQESSSVGRMVTLLWLWIRDYYEELEEKGFGSVRKVAEVYRHLAEIGKGIPLGEFIDLENRKEAKLIYHNNSDQAIKIHTMHTVKGLEFSSVYMLGLNGNIIPDETRIEAMQRKIEEEQLPEEEMKAQLAVLEEYVEEERRLFYVGWTRAKDKLVIQFDSSNPSRFIEEVDLSNALDLMEAEESEIESEAEESNNNNN